MHHRAIRHIHAAPNATTLTFSAFLQAAAGRAWSRSQSKSASLPSRLVESPCSTHISTPASSPSSNCAIPVPSIPCPAFSPRPKHKTFAGYISPEKVQDSDLRRIDPGRSFTKEFQYDPPIRQHDEHKSPWFPKDLATSDSRKPLKTFPVPVALPVKTRSALYQNLLYLLSHRDPVLGLPALLDYHDLHTGLRSTRSYNLLVAQALRHASFGTVQWLLKAMKADGLPGNVETWKLKVRWLIQTGWWDQAWNEVMESRNRTNPGCEYQESPPVPPQIWLEFFRTSKRTPTRICRTGHREFDNSSQESQTLAERPDITRLHLARYYTLAATYPVLTHKELAQASPRMVYFVVMTMLNSQQGASALSFTQAFFKALPPTIPRNWARICQEIIHLHIALGSSQKGLRRLYECRRTMVSLTKAHSSLKPTSTTLFLLLSPLRDVKRCGTVAWNICKSFRQQWGANTIDRRVRRRVANLAMKEGRMDIVDKVLSSEKTFRRAHGMWKRTMLTFGGIIPSRPRKLLKPPGKKLFRYNGREERLWQLFRRRKRRMTMRRRIKYLIH